jgi:hypothetical protein
MDAANTDAMAAKGWDATDKALTVSDWGAGRADAQRAEAAQRGYYVGPQAGWRERLAISRPAVASQPEPPLSRQSCRSMDSSIWLDRLMKRLVCFGG